MNSKHFFYSEPSYRMERRQFRVNSGYKGRDTFQRGIINTPCFASGVVDRILLSECPDITTSKSAPGMKPVLVVSSLDHTTWQRTLFATNRARRETW